MISLMSDPVHLMKKAAQNLYSSGNSDYHTKRIEKGGEFLRWDMFKYAWDQDNSPAKALGTVIAYNVTRDHIKRSGFTRLKTKYSVQMFSRKMQLCVNTYHEEETNQLQRYMFHMDRYIDIMNSGRWRKEWTGDKAYLCAPIRSMDDRRIKELVETMAWFDDWNDENQQRAAESNEQRRERFITDELYYDIRLAIRGFVAHCGQQLDGSKGEHAKVIPRLYNQDCVEGHFSLLRAAGGAETHMNAVSLPAHQASALQTTNHGGIAAGSSGQATGNVSANHSVVVDTFICIKTRRVVKKEREQRQKDGRELARGAGIDVPS